MPKFLERRQGENAQTRQRGASMKPSPQASKLVGSHAFLTQQYNAVVEKQQNGESTNEHKAEAAMPLPLPPAVTPSSVSPPELQRPSTAADIKPISDTGALAEDPKKIGDFLGSVRDVIVLRRHTGADERWCQDLDLVLREAMSVLHHFTHERQRTHALEEEIEILTKRVDKLRTMEGNTSDELVRAQDLVAKQKGQIIRLEGEVQSTQILLSDEKERILRLQADLKKAQKAELAAMEIDVHKSENTRLAGRLAALESDNAILLAEKAQWLSQLRSENEQLQELFEDARSAKDVMVRELNAVDKERHQLAKMRLDLAHQLEYVGASGYTSEDKIEHDKMLAAVEAKHASAQSKVDQLEAELSSLRAEASKADANLTQARKEAASLRGTVQLTEDVFAKMSQASLKFHKLEARLKRRQGKMSVTFDSGIALYEKYQDSGNTTKAQLVIDRLMQNSMNADEALLAEAVEQQTHHENAVAIVNKNPNLRELANEFRQRLDAQTATMQDGIAKMGRMFVEAFNHAQSGTLDNSILASSMMNINMFYDSLMSKALQAGGSHNQAAVDVDEELTFRELYARSKERSGGGGGASLNAEQQALINKLEYDLEQSRAEQQRLNEVKNVLVANITNTKALLKRYKNAVTLQKDEI